MKKITYNIGVFLTSRSSQEWKDLVAEAKTKKLYGTERLAYYRGLTRAEVLEVMKNFPNEQHVIYCPERDSYVSDYFMDDFKDLNSNYAKLMFDEGRHQCQWIGDVMVFQGNVGVDVKTNKIVKVKWINPDTPVVHEN